MSNPEAFLAHYGVLGMKWGRRKADTSPVEVSTQHTPGKKVTAKGGQNQPAHEDAIKTAASRQKAKASTTDALSTEELRKMVDRMNLEQQYSKLSANQLSPGRKMINDMLMNTVKQEGQKAVNKAAAEGITKLYANKATKLSK